MSKIDYNLKKIKAVVFDVDGVLSPSTIPMDSEGSPCRMINIKDGYAIQLAVKNNISISIITGADSTAIIKRFKSLGVSDIYTKVSLKLPLLKKWMESKQLKPDEVAYVGDDIPDMPCMNYIGLSIAPNDASVDVKNIARYISPINGGYGVARDILEELMRAKEVWLSNIQYYEW